MAADPGIADDGTTQLNLPSLAQQSDPTVGPLNHGDGTFTYQEWYRRVTGMQRSHKLAHATGGRDALVASDIGASQALTPTAVKTTNYTAAPGDLVPVDTTSGAVTITLPTAPADKTRIAVKLVILGGSNAVTIARGGADVFNKAGGSTSLTLSLLFQAVNLQYKASGAIWYVVADDLPLGDLDARYVAGALDTDATLAANSDTRVPSQKAVKAYADALIAAADAMVYKGVIDCSANPNYPAANAGWFYKVSVAGKIGGASGPNVEAGDTLLCVTDATASGTQAGVGANWDIIQVNIDGAVVGPASSTDGAVALFDGASGKLIKASTVLSAFIATLLDDADAATARTTLGLGTAATHATGDYDAAGAAAAAQAASQPLDTELTAIAALVSAANKLPYFTGSGAAALTDLSAFIRTLLDDADAATARSTLGLGSLATKSAVASADITDGTIVAADIATGAVLLPGQALGVFMSSGLYWYNPGTVGSGKGMTNNQMFAVPLWIPTAQTLTRIGIKVSTIGAGTGGAGSKVIRLGVYGDTGGGYPSALLLDAGVSGSASTILSNGFIDATNTAAQEVTISLAVAARTLIWLVGVAQGCDTTAPQVNKVTSDGQLVNAASTIGIALGNSAGGWASPVGTTSGALPDPWPAGTAAPDTAPMRMAIKV